jgi:tetratricopeptide (TPR) repeat protein
MVEPRLMQARSAWPWIAAAAATLVFARALRGEFVYDDLTLIAQNPNLHDPLDVKAWLTRPLWGEQLGHWRPLAGLAFAAGWTIAGGEAWGIHAIALAAHAAAAALAFGLAVRLLAGPRPATPREARAAGLAALLFALHPAQAEAVGWCAALNDVLWGLGALVAMRAFLGWRDRGSRGQPAGAALAFGLALLCKETALCVPLLLASIDVARAREPGTAERRPWRGYASFALVLAAYVLARAAVFGEAGAGFGRAPIRIDDGLLAQAGVRLAILERSAMHLVWPVGHGMFDPVRVPASLGALALRLAVPAVLVAAAAIAWRRRSAAALVALALLVVPLAPGLVRPQNLGPYPIADRYLYLPALGLALLLARAAWPLGLAVLAVAFGAVSYFRLDLWRDQPTFVARSLATAGDDPRRLYEHGRLQLGRASLGDATALRAAEAAFAAARERMTPPPYGGPRAAARLGAQIDVGLAWCAFLGQGAAAAPDWPAVLRRFDAVRARFPDLADAHVGSGVVLAAMGRLREAEAALARAIAVDPGTKEAHFNLGRVYRLLGDRARARVHFEEAQRIAPGDPAAAAALRELAAGG